MKLTTIPVRMDTEKLRAIKFYAEKKDSSLESELEDYIQKLYEKYVPAQTREYIEQVAEDSAPAKRSGRITSSGAKDKKEGAEHVG